MSSDSQESKIYPRLSMSLHRELKSIFECLSYALGSLINTGMFQLFDTVQFIIIKVLILCNDALKI